MALLSPLFHPLQQRGANWMSSYQKQQFLGNYNADLHLKVPFVLGSKRSEGEKGNRESTLLHRPQTQRPWQLYKQNSPVFLFVPPPPVSHSWARPGGRIWTNQIHFIHWETFRQFSNPNKHKQKRQENGPRFPWLPQYKVSPATAMRINEKIQKARHCSSHY